MSLAGQVGIITGGAAGLGLAFAKKLLAAGCSVCLVDVANPAPSDMQFLQENYANKVLIHQGDVRTQLLFREAIEKAKSTFNVAAPTIMINNAGVGDEINVSRAIGINFEAVVNGTLISAESMIAAKKPGVIINIASMGGLVPMPFAPVYAGTKAAVIHFSRSISQSPRLLARGIRVNVVCPSFTRTALVDRLMAEGPAMKQAVEAQGPLMEPEFIAKGLMELVEDSTKNGQVQIISQQSGITYQRYGGFDKSKDKEAKSKL